MTDRPTLDVATPPGGWGMPWPNVAEIGTALPHESWHALPAAHRCGGQAALRILTA